MKRCEFCEHHAYTENLEEVCTKHLMYLGDIEKDFPCKEFQTSHQLIPVVVGVTTFVALLFLMVLLVS